MSEIEAVILDYGEVVCRKPGPEPIARMAAAFGLDPAVYETRYHRHRGPYDRGELAPEEYWSTVAARPIDVEVLTDLRRWDVEQWTDIDAAMTGWLERLRAAGFKSAVLSNMHPDMAGHVRGAFDWLRGVDCAILSCELGLIKPEPAIYERCLDCLGVRPSAALFIDDRENNVAAADALGLHTIRFRSVEQLTSELEDRGFPVLPRKSS